MDMNFKEQPSDFKADCIDNPFPNASWIHRSSLDSTMNLALSLAKQCYPEGTVISADEQTAGRGRGTGRRWVTAKGLDIACTLILLPQPSMLEAFTLKLGLTVRKAILDVHPEIPDEDLLVKWPNDLLLAGKKISGLLCESKSCTVLAGIGINCNTLAYPEELSRKATSLALYTGKPVDRWEILQALLHRIHAMLRIESQDDSNWLNELSGHLWKIDEAVVFESGPADSGKCFYGRIAGVSRTGELQIMNEDGSMCQFVAGEIRFPG